MAAIISDKFRIFNAKQFLTSLGDDVFDNQGNLVVNPDVERNRMYFFVGRPQRWDAYIEIYSRSVQNFSVGEEVQVGAGGSTFRATVRTVSENALLVHDVFPTPSSVPPLGSTLTGVDSGATAKTGVYRYATEEVPPMPLDNQSEKNAVYDELIAAKRISTAYARAVVRRYNWDLVTNPKFDMWKPDYSATPGGGTQVGKQTATLQDNIANAKFYVMNSDYEVFKCLYNGQNPSNASGQNASEEPLTSGVNYNAGTGLYTETTGAGYIWKYMYTIPTDDVLKFLSTDFMPIVLPSNPSRSNVTAAAVDGSINVVIIEDGGSGFPANRGAGNPLYAAIKGDGQNGVVQFWTNGSGTITTAVIEDAGSGYTYANIPLRNGDVYTDAGLSAGIATTGTGALEAILPPLGGHGFDHETEFNAKRVMTNIRLTYAEGSGDFPVDNDFRRIGIIKDPYQWGTTSYLTQETASGLKAIKINGASADYIPDETISQDNGANGIAYGTVVSWTLDDPDAGNGNGVLKYIQTNDLHTDGGVVNAFESNANAVEGGLSNASGAVATTYNTGGGVLPLLGHSFTAGLSTPEIETNSGEFIYIENRRLITRAPDQIEDIKLVIEF